MALDILEPIHAQCGNGDLPQKRQTEDRADAADEAVEPQVDTFLKEAVNSRNRITVLRLEQDIERFVRNATQLDLLLKPMQSSYERLAAHRIAQHYGLQSMVVTAAFPKVSRILLVKTVETSLPSIRLADIPVDNGLEDKHASIISEKVAIKQRESKTLFIEGSNESNESGRTPLKTMEEREEEYDKARARIFNSSDASSSVSVECGIAVGMEQHKSPGSSSPSSGLLASNDSKGLPTNPNRVAIFRDREKDMRDPDYDRGSRRYPQLVDPSATAAFSTLQRVCSPSNSLNKLNCMEGQWAPHLLVEHLNYMPAPPLRGPRLEACYPDSTYMHYGQNHSDAYWQCQTFLSHPANAYLHQSKDGFPFSFQHGFQSATSLGALGR